MSNTSLISKDIKASIVVFLVALPLCLGISLASGAPLFAGILAGIIGGIIIGSISKSHTSVSGPAAGLTVIVITAIETLGDFQTFTLAVLIAGALQVAMGCLRAGNAGSYFPNSVIKGMLAAIGLILILKQIPHFVGFDHSIIGDDAFLQKDGQNTFSEILLAAKAVNIGALLISLISLIGMILWDKQAKKGNKFFQLMPAPLFAVLAGVLFNQLIISKFDGLYLTEDHFVSLPIEGGITSFINLFKLPNWEGFSNFAVYKVAVTLAIVASLETLLSIEAVDKLDPYKRVSNKNRELVAQGVGNFVLGLIGGLPATSVIVRSSANVATGNRTKLSAILHGVWMMLAVIFIPRYLELIPLASLAAILILIGYKLSPPSLFKQMKKDGYNQFIPFVVTVLAILFTDLLLGIFIGMMVGFFFVIRSSSKKSIVVVNEGSDYLIRFMKDVSFLQKPFMKKTLYKIPPGSSVVIDGSSHLRVDDDVISIIQEFQEASEERNVKCEIIKSSLALNRFFKA
jgi:MFS superfamily sulfate permease-like transporter